MKRKYLSYSMSNALFGTKVTSFFPVIRVSIMMYFKYTEEAQKKVG